MGILDLFGELVIKKDGSHYLSSKTTFSDLPLRIYFRTTTHIGLRSIEVTDNHDCINNVVYLTLNVEYLMNSSLIPKGGFLTMGKDYKLSDRECAFFYSHNINYIRYMDENDDVVLYDMDVIMRRCTIDNIIND